MCSCYVLEEWNKFLFGHKLKALSFRSGASNQYGICLKPQMNISRRSYNFFNENYCTRLIHKYKYANSHGDVLQKTVIYKFIIKLF